MLRRATVGGLWDIVASPCHHVTMSPCHHVTMPPSSSSSSSSSSSWSWCWSSSCHHVAFQLQLHSNWTKRSVSSRAPNQKRNSRGRLGHGPRSCLAFSQPLKQGSKHRFLGWIESGWEIPQYIYIYIHIYIYIIHIYTLRQHCQRVITCNYKIQKHHVFGWLNSGESHQEDPNSLCS